MSKTLIQFICRRAKRLPSFAVLFLLLIAVPGGTVRGESYSKFIETDLDADGIAERIDLDSGREQTLQIRRGDAFLWEGVPKKWKPWKIEIADVDGDGKREIAVGVFKSTKFFPKPHNCLFIYGFDKNEAYPKWLGSSLSRPFTDFLFADLDKQSGRELIAVETTVDGKQALSTYFWDSFGFTRKWQRGDWDLLEIVGAEDGKITVAADNEQIILTGNEMREKQ